MKSLKVILFILSFVFTVNVAAQEVYVTKTGEKYHKESCRYLNYSKKEITLKKAIELGYDACKVCKPTKTISSENSNSISNSSTVKTLPKKTTSSQCTGRTKAGKRCKRMTKSANGRCYQH